jgi:carbamoyl-phosphate synthase large subunit
MLFRGADPRFIDDVLARCIEARVEIVVPAVDVELLAFAKRRVDFASRGIALMLASDRALEACIDKWRLVTTCAGVCPVPATAIVDDTFAANPWPVPFIVKPRRGSGGSGMRRIDDLASFADCPRDGRMVAQEVLSGAEYSVDVLSDRDALPLAVVPRSRLKIDSGIAVTGRTVRNDRLVSLATAVATSLGLTFVSNIQFREDASGTPKLLDVNARFPGTMPLTVAAGIDMPNLALDALLGRPIDARSLRYEDLAVTRTWQEHFIPVAELSAMERATRERDERP